MAICRNCGMINEDGSKYCTECGAALGGETARSAPTAQGKQKKPIYKRWWFWVLVLIVIGNIARGGSRSSTQPTTRQSAPAVTTTAKPTAKPTASPTARPTPKPTEKPATTALDESVIRPEIKQFLDSYEAFMDVYIVFMQKYQESDSDDSLSMLMDLSNMLTRMNEFEQKLDALDESDMTEAEALYYSEVMLRVSQKLLAAGIA